MSQLRKYKYQCANNDWFTTEYLDRAPTLCPDSHSIESNKIYVISQVLRNSVYINDDSGQTQGYYFCKGHQFDCNSTQDSETHYNISDGNFDQEVFSMHFLPTSSNIGDAFSIHVNPDTAIGTLMAEATIGSSTFNVSPTVIVHMVKGFLCSLNNSGTIEDVGRVTAIDSDNNTITVENALSQTFPSGSVVRLTVPRVLDMPIVSTNRIDLGENRTGGTFSKAGTIGRITYVNKTGGTKKFSFYVQQTY